MKLLTLVASLLMAALMLTGASCTKQQDNIAIACTSVASGLDAITAAHAAGRVNDAQLREAITIADSTTGFCEPVAESLSMNDYLKLTGAAAELTQRAGEAK